MSSYLGLTDVMPFLDLNSYEAAPLVAAAFLFIVFALVRVWRDVPRTSHSLVLTGVVFAVPVVGALVAVQWARRCRFTAAGGAPRQVGRTPS